MKKICFPTINYAPKIEVFFVFQVVLIFLFITAGPFTGRAYSAQESPCLACHPDIKKPTKSVHAALAMGCETCHKVAEGKSHPDQKNSIVLIKNVPGLCYNCHDQAKFTKGKSGHTSVGMCMGCHNPHASDYDKLLKAPQPELCYTCHEKSKFNKKYVHSIIAAGGCTACHTPHISQYRALLPGNDINELCVTCHVNKADGRHIISIPGKRVHPVKGVPDLSTTTLIQVVDPTDKHKSKLVPDPKHPGKMMSCISCHNPHSSDFKNLFPTAKLCTRCHKDY